jgi:hypothetical protein
MVDIIVVILCSIIASILIHSWKNSKRNANTDEKLALIKSNLVKVDPRAENVDFYTHPEEAYTLGKKEIYMCIQDPEGNYYSNDTLMYIALHELAHVLIPGDTSKHPPKFDALFNQLKERAEYLGLYDPRVPFPTKYCGKELSYY